MDRNEEVLYVHGGEVTKNMADTLSTLIILSKFLNGKWRTPEI